MKKETPFSFDSYNCINIRKYIFILKIFSRFYFISLCVSLCWGVHMSVVANRVQKRASDTLDLELQNGLRLLTGTGKLA